jgi:ribosomal protein S18 acetylase RimI-like enzyme
MSRTWVAGPEEADDVAALIVAFSEHLGGSEPTLESARSSVARLLEDPGTEFLLASDGDGPPAAVLQLRFRWSVWKGAPDAWLEDLFVRAEARRSGLGDALVRLAIERAAARGARRIELDCFEDNEPALALYERNGFSMHSKGASRALLLGRPI